MVPHEVLRELSLKTPSKIVFLMIDGLGGLPRIAGGLTELETARRPNLNRLAAAPGTLLGLAEIVGPGITPGSGAGHLALFGYDPIRYSIGRGVLSAYGIGVEVGPEDVCIRGNFATLDEKGMVTDRRAGRLKTELCRELCETLAAAVPRIEDVSIAYTAERDYRFVARLRGPGLGERVTDTDPQKEGHKALPALAQDPGSEKTARIVNLLTAKAETALRGRRPANGVLLRGFARRPALPSLPTLYGLKPACVGTYPMYRGLAHLLGMDVLKTSEEEDLGVLARTVESHWDGYDFFFVHVKKADSHGEDGNFEAKVKVLEAVDRDLVPALMGLMPDVFVVTGDHSTPSIMKAHSWHPVPFLLHSKWVRRPSRAQEEFGETACAAGLLGTFPAIHAMSHALACAQKLAKFGA
ncbi:MAG TPA: 2,3-bisphosphoglycerate-independent phosphoglycerate mutase [Planctomycetota bacterium]|nr:2,3-bisphosphoglycerate-independent phosphoglycerate mutase [Planctomycetota bacterium]